MGHECWNVGDLRLVLGSFSNESMALCDGRVRGMDVVLSGSFSSTGINLVTHDLANVIPEIDRVLLNSRGRIVADGAKEEILQPVCLGGVFGIEADIAWHEGYYHLW